jgi:hypothetical protein
VTLRDGERVKVRAQSHDTREHVLEFAARDKDGVLSVVATFAAGTWSHVKKGWKKARGR